MANVNVLEFTSENWQKEVEQSDQPVVVDFWAPWCGPCRQVAPILEKLAAEYDGKLVIAKVNTDENYEWAQHFEVRGIPTMLFVAGGKVVYQQVGAVPAGYLKQIVDKFLETVAPPVLTPSPAPTTGQA